MPRTLLLGLGNPLMGDDGIGLAALAQLLAQHELPPEVEVMDGGTWGMNLLPVIESHRQVVLLDAINTGAAPGSLVELGRDGLPRYFQHKLSPHQIDLREVLALAEWRGTLPDEIVALGIQPELVELHDGLSPRVAQALPGLVARAATRLEAMGHRCPCRLSLARA
jgi:hydrogenase maturation protease